MEDHPCAGHFFKLSKIFFHTNHILYTCSSSTVVGHLALSASGPGSFPTIVWNFVVNVVLDIGVRLTILLTLVSGINVDQRCSGRLVRHASLLPLVLE